MQKKMVRTFTWINKQSWGVFYPPSFPRFRSAFCSGSKTVASILQGISFVRAPPETHSVAESFQISNRTHVPLSFAAQARDRSPGGLHVMCDMHFYKEVANQKWTSSSGLSKAQINLGKNVIMGKALAFPPSPGCCSLQVTDLCLHLPYVITVRCRDVGNPLTAFFPLSDHWWSRNLWLTCWSSYAKNSANIWAIS